MKYVLAIILCLIATQADAQRGGWGHGGGWHGGWHGGGFGGGIVGGIIGGVIGGAIARPYYDQQPYYAPQFDPVAYCAQRFRSYNPATGLYFGYDGQYHPCP